MRALSRGCVRHRHVKKKESRRWIDVVEMTLVREGSSEGWRTRVRDRHLGDRRYQRRSLGWLVVVTVVVVVMVVVAAEMVVVVVVEWRQGVGTGGKWGQINANMCGKLHRDRSQDPREKRGLYVFLCHSLSCTPLMYPLCLRLLYLSFCVFVLFFPLFFFFSLFHADFVSLFIKCLLFSIDKYVIYWYY